MNTLLSQAITTFLAENIIIMLALLFVLPFGAWKVRGWKGNIEDELRRLSMRMDDFHTFLSSKFGNPLVASLSPLALNERGQQIAKTIDAAPLASHYADQLQDQVGTMNAYQIQELCFAFARDHLLKDLEATDAVNFNRVTTCAYEEGIDPAEIMRVIGILMRDILLKNAGHSHQAVDDHTPPTSAL